MNTDSESSDGLRMSLRKRPRKLHAERKLKQQNDELKYLDDLDEKAARAKRKLNNRKKQGYAHDEYGRLRQNGMDLCDCLQEDCEGCWYECENCGSTKCGVQCRVNRRFVYEVISFDGKDAMVRNAYYTSK